MRTAYWAINQEKKETYMSKNLTRKGLALGAVVALGSSLFAGTPATAAPTAIFLQSAFGTSTTGVLGQYFTLAASAAGRVDNDVIEFFVEGVSSANVSAVGRVVTDLEASGNYTDIMNEQNTSTDLKQTSYGAAFTAGSYLQFGIKLDSTLVTSTTSIKVTPFFDGTVNNNKPDAGELAGTPITINFVKGSELTATPTITASAPGAVVKATTAVSGGVNLEQFRLNATGGHAETPFTVDFKETGSNWTSPNSNVDVVSYWDKSRSVFEAVSTSSAVVSKVYGATANINGIDSVAGTAANSTAGEVASLTNVAIGSSASYRSISASSVAGSNTANVIRAGSGSFTASSDVTAVAGKKNSGQKVTFTITEVSGQALPAGATISAGGKTLTISKAATVEFIEVDATSDADGTASLPITYSGITDGKFFEVDVAAVSATGAATGGSLIRLTAQDSFAEALSDLVQDSNSSAVRNVAKGGAISIPLTIVDQFGQTPTGTFRVVVTNSGNPAPAAVSPVAVSGGKVTITATDNTTAATNSYNITATLEKLGADGTSYSAISQGAVTANYAITVGAVATASTIAIATTNTTTAVVRAGKTLIATNLIADQESKALAARDYLGTTTLNSTVTSTTGANAAGVAVTYSAAGVLFKAGNILGLGSVTVYTGADGTTGAVNIFSNLVGKATITVTSGSATKTQLVTYAPVTTGGSAWTVTAPASILPGQTLKVSAVLKDATGAVVDTSGLTGANAVVKVSYTGPGFVTATLPTATDVDGVVSFNVLLGSMDSGTATVKFTYANTNGFDEVTLNDDVISTASIIIGKAPVVAGSTSAAIAGSTNRMFVSVSGNTLARNVVVKVAGRTVATLKGSTAAKRTYTIRSTKGSKKVTVFVGGKLIATKTVTVK
jgi:hypothetical protein